MSRPLGRKLTRKKWLFFSTRRLPWLSEILSKAFLGYKKYYQKPSLIGRGKRASFNYIKKRLWRKLQGWEGKLLSQVGREVLIKFVIQAILTFAMGCFKLPVGLCYEIEAMVKIFWWGQHGNRRKNILDSVGEVNKIQIDWRNGFQRLNHFPWCSTCQTGLVTSN